MRQTTYLNHYIQTTPLLTFYFSTLFQFARLHTHQTTFFLPDYTTRAAPKFYHSSKDLEKAAGTDQTTYIADAYDREAEKAAGDYTATTRATRLHNRRAASNVGANYTLQQQETTYALQAAAP